MPYHCCGLKYSVWKPTGLHSFFPLLVKFWEMIWFFKILHWYLNQKSFTLVQTYPAVRSLIGNMGEHVQVPFLIILMLL